MPKKVHQEKQARKMRPKKVHQKFAPIKAPKLCTKKYRLKKADQKRASNTKNVCPMQMKHTNKEMTSIYMWQLTSD
jgi:hypothetical protein